MCGRLSAESLATGKPASSVLEMRMLATDGGAPMWVENKVTFSGVRWYGVWRDVSAAKKAEVRS